MNGQYRVSRLKQLFNPASIAVVGGEIAAEVIRQSRKIGYKGQIWPINPRRSHIEGMATYPDVASLPGVPEASFVAVPRLETIEVVRALAKRGAAGAVCYASGFAEVGGDGVALQEQLVEAAGPMALLGPNCYGVINFLDGCTLWPDHFGGTRVARGVAIIAQSGNIALNLTMQRHHLPIAYMVALGNKAVSDIHDCIEVVLDDERVTAIGLYLEGLTDVAAFARAAQLALARGIPIVVLKVGASEVGAELAASHTRSLAGSDVLYTALFRRLGVARVAELGEFLETLKLLHTCGTVEGVRVGSLSCSGGDALMMADLGETLGLEFPTLDSTVHSELAQTLGPLVAIHNPLDYQTYIWEDEPALTACFTSMMKARIDVCLLVLDFPNAEAGALPGWDHVIKGFIAARASTDKPCIMVSSMAELMPAEAAQRLYAAGIAPLQGLREAVVAITAAAGIAARRRDQARITNLIASGRRAVGPEIMLDEQSAKAALARHGLQIPEGRCARGLEKAVEAAEELGYPVVVKAISAGLAHKTEMGAVKLNLANADAVRAAIASIQAHFDVFLVEKMVKGGIAELIVGVTRDAQFGLALTIGAGGILVELLADSVTLLLPSTRADIEDALRSLRCFVLLDGYRGQPQAKLDQVIDAIEAIADYAEKHAAQLLELDVNPLIACEDAVWGVDALVRLIAPGSD